MANKAAAILVFMDEFSAHYTSFQFPMRKQISVDE